jgi:hypothetical protein
MGREVVGLYRSLAPIRRYACDAEYAWQHSLPYTGTDTAVDGSRRQSCAQRLIARYETLLRRGDPPDLGFSAAFFSVSDRHAAMKAAPCDGYPVSKRSVSRSFTRLGFALRSVSRITSPNRKPRFFFRVLSSPAR